MFRKITLSACAVLGLMTGAALAESAESHITDVPFSWEGPFGKYDKNQLQRGLQVYTEVCAGCHGMKFVPIRSLADPGGPELPDDQVRAYAKTLDAFVGPDGTERPREATDKFPTRSGEGMGPDLSLMAKARAGFHGPYGTGVNQLVHGIGGPEYIYSILTGFKDAPDCAPADFPGNYNTVFAPGGYPDECKIYEERTIQKTDDAGNPVTVTEKVEVGRKAPGSWIAMPKPLSDDQVTYADGHPAKIADMAEDVSAFLMWAAEPKMMDRKHTGFLAVVFLAIFGCLLYLTNKRLWAKVKGKENA